VTSPCRSRVLVVTPDFPPTFGGIQRLMQRLAEHLERLDVRVITLGGPEARGFDVQNQLDVRRAPSAGLVGHPRAIAVLNAHAFAEAARYKPNVVLSGHINVSPAALVIKRVFRTPYVQYVHGRELVIRPRLTRAGLGGARAIIAVSVYTRELAVRNGADPKGVHVIPPGVDLPTEEAPPRAERPTIVSVARLEQRYKGHDILIRALPLVRSRVPGARLLLIGGGPMQPVYENLARSLGLDGDVEFTGPVDDAERDRLLGSAHVFAMTSRLPRDGGGEGFGIVYLEAAAHGLPAVAGDIAGARDAVVDGQTGMLVDPTDHVAVADALTALLRDRETGERLGKAAALRAQDYTWPKIARRVEDLLLSAAQ
jgi:phosphatidylinositol alpha-1,6-mannosyltransferase